MIWQKAACILVLIAMLYLTLILLYEFFFDDGYL